MTKVILFDIDGTLIHSGGSGKVAMEAAFEEVFGIPSALKDVHLSGRTDIVILQDAMQRQNILWDDKKTEDFKESYFRHLAKDLMVPREHRRMMPGITELINTLENKPEFILGLLTGNWIASAEIKLAHFKLWQHFKFGAFADDEAERNKLVPHAVRRVREQYDITVEDQHVYILGDTPRDIHCAVLMELPLLQLLPVNILWISYALKNRIIYLRIFLIEMPLWKH